MVVTQAIDQVSRGIGCILLTEIEMCFRTVIILHYSNVLSRLLLQLQS